MCNFFIKYRKWKIVMEERVLYNIKKQENYYITIYITGGLL